MIDIEINEDKCTKGEKYIIKTTETIYKFLNDDRWTKGEKFIIKWQFNSLRLLGDFSSTLIKAISLADENNLKKLELGFPEEVGGFRAWAHGDLGKRLREAGLINI